MISNLSQLWTEGGAGDFETVIPGSGYGFAFTTGSSPYALDTVTLEELGGPGTVQVELLASQGGTFSPVEQLGNPTIDPRQTQWPTLTSFIDYSPITPFTLSPDTSYIVAAYEPVNGDDNTALTFNANDYTVSADWSVYGAIPTLFYHGSSPPDTVSPGTVGTGWRRYQPYGLMVEIDATPVPEPGMGKLIFASLGTLGLYRLLRSSENRQLFI